MNTVPVVAPPRLADRITRWKAALRSADTGPLVIAEDVLQIAGEWERYRVEARGLDCTSWLRKELGRGRSLAFFERRAHAVKVLGEACRRVLHHDVAVWIAGRVRDPEAVQRVMWALMRATKKQGGNCLTPAQARPIVLATLGIERAPRTIGCARCAELERLLAEHGIVLPEEAEAPPDVGGDPESGGRESAIESDTWRANEEKVGKPIQIE